MNARTLLIVLLGLLLTIAILPVAFLRATREEKSLDVYSLPVVVTARVNLDMQSSTTHTYNSLWSGLPDGRPNQKHRMVCLYGSQGLDTYYKGNAQWFDVDSLTFEALKVDTTYYLSMYPGGKHGSLRKWRASWSVSLIID